MKTRGLFISIEGGEGSGKSTLQHHIESFFSSQQVPCISTREPGGTPFAEQARSVLLSFSKSYPMSPLTEVLLLLAARSDHVEKTIAPALQEGKCVICDRFIDSTMAYQAYGRGGDYASLWRLCLEAVPLIPNLTFYLDLPLNEAFSRLTRRQQDKRDRMESEQESFHERVRNGFLDLSKRYPQRIVVLDASQSEELVAQKAIEAIHLRFPGRFLYP